MSSEEHRPPLNPTALSLADAARMLSKVGGQPINDAAIADDLLAGAPTNANGTINLVHYAAWLVKEMGRGD